MIEPYYQADRVTLYLGDCIEVMRQLPEASVDAIVTDPPYGLEFMGKAWDSFRVGRSEKYASGGTLNEAGARGGQGGAGPSYVNRPAKRCRNCGRQAWSGSPCKCEFPEWELDNSPLRSFQQWCEAWAREAYRVLKPGGYLLAFGGTRTYHRLASGVEDAGFEVRDTLAWMYGSGFPKSLDVSKALDKAAGAEREVVGRSDNGIAGGTGRHAGEGGAYGFRGEFNITAPTSEEAKQWEGWGTALKPAHEPVVVARKPLSGTVAANVLAHGTGALNIDGTRIGTDRRFNAPAGNDGRSAASVAPVNITGYEGAIATGRWPANVILDEEAAALLDAQAGERVSGLFEPHHADNGKDAGTYGAMGGRSRNVSTYGDRGGASRFFHVARWTAEDDFGVEVVRRFHYTAKASRTEREAGLDDLPPALRTDGRPPEGPGADNPRLRVSERRNDHPTVKPVSLMRWLCKLITPPGGVVLDPFLGSGTTGMAALDEGFKFIGIDMTERYVEIARYRVTHRHVIDHEVRPANEALPQGRLL